jgi:hypothetical protein
MKTAGGQNLTDDNMRNVFRQVLDDKDLALAFINDKIGDEPLTQ